MCLYNLRIVLQSRLAIEAPARSTTCSENRRNDLGSVLVRATMCEGIYLSKETHLCPYDLKGVRNQADTS
jgi:hypothetical protein